MLKRVDVATAKTFSDAKDGTWKPGATTLGLKEDGVAWADDEHNKPLITADMRAAVTKAADDIKSGRVSVHDYMADSRCPG
jgi:basic membrane protein A